MLEPIIVTSLKRKNIPLRQTPDPTGYWGAEFFGLDGVGYFNELSLEARESVLADCSRVRIEETWNIERHGLKFTSKMTEQAESDEEHTLYALMAGEEATHFRMISSFLNQEPAPAETNPVNPMLAQLIAEGSRYASIFCVQVMLEGWGLTHYQRMMTATRNEELRQSLRQILNDEARHHGGGQVVLKGLKPTAREEKEALDWMARFCAMVAVGPHWLLGMFETKLGHLSREQKLRVLEGLDGRGQAQFILDGVKRLVSQNDPTGRVHARLEELGCYGARSHEEVAAL